MDPCTVPSLVGAPAKTTSCGCATQPAEQTVFAYESAPDRSHGMSFDPVTHAPVGEPLMIFLSLGWLVFAAVSLFPRRGAPILRLGLAGAPPGAPALVSRRAPAFGPRLATASRACGTT